ncbi:response regulator [Streptomyces goshikiensis]|uniref:response regulator n=1 Tax=Streptomyces goshikiensis TaxID=1942 RepID=UPI00364C76A5
MAKKILLVDDSEAARKSVAFTLRQSGYEATEVSDGAEGVEKAKNATFDLVITDISLPVIDGLALACELRQLPEYKLKPILVMGSEAELSKVNQAKESGVSGWLLKPFDGAKLLSTVGRLLK